MTNEKSRPSSQKLPSQSLISLEGQKVSFIHALFARRAANADLKLANVELLLVS